MSHVFISYKNEDQYQLSALKAVLDKAGIIYWYDHGLSAGEDWRNEIDNRIDNCSAMVVIITHRSVESHYVTYEWSRALGSGKAIIPALFEKDKPERLHSCLASLQSIPCFPHIPDGFADEVIRRSKESFLSRYTRYSIVSKFQSLRTLIYIVRVNEVLKAQELNVSYVTELSLLDGLIREIHVLKSETLVQFWLNSAHALSLAQRRLFEEISSRIETLGRYCFDASNSRHTEYTLQNLDEELPSDHKDSQDLLKGVIDLWQQTEDILITAREEQHDPFSFYIGQLRIIFSPNYVSPKKNTAERIKIAVDFIDPMTSRDIMELLRQVEREISDKCAS